MSESTWWEDVSPAWLFRAKPADFTDQVGAVCSGVYSPFGWLALLGIHFVSFGLPFTVAAVWGWQSWLPLLTLPTVLLWALLMPADIKFRRQRPTRGERGEFDSAVINWIGFVTFPAFHLVPVAFVIGVVWWVVSLFV